MDLTGCRMQRSSINRLLRIAASTTGLTACVLSMVLWVRSYRSKDVVFGGVTKSRVVAFESVRGRVKVRSYIDPRAMRWGAESWSRNSQRFATDSIRVYLFSVPHWFLVILAATLGIAPLISQYKHGLLVLLTAFTLMCVLWAIVVALNQ